MGKKKNHIYSFKNKVSGQSKIKVNPKVRWHRAFALVLHGLRVVQEFVFYPFF